MDAGKVGYLKWVGSWHNAHVMGMDLNGWASEGSPTFSVVMFEAPAIADDPKRASGCVDGHFKLDI